MTAGAVPTGVATGVGSLPGEDIDSAVALVFDTLPDLPHLPELPARGPGADMIGRTAGALADLHVDLQPAGWRLVPNAGLDERRAVELLERDIDAVVPVAAGYAGAFKVQLAGPWTLAATLELPRGGKVVGDAGAVRDVVASLAETAAEHLAQVARRMPAASLVLQLDEPALPGVLAGQVPTASGFGRLRAVDAAVARDALRQVIAAAGVPVVVHCCAAEVPFTLLHEAGAAAASLDLGEVRRLGRLDVDELGERVDRGLALWLGVVPSIGPGAPPSVRELLAPARELWHRMGFAPERVAAGVTLTPACGLAGASDGWARTALRLVTQGARALVEEAA